jgi:hypothetical protein
MSTDETDTTDVFAGFVEEGTRFEWVDTGAPVVVESIRVDEDATVHVYITDEQEGYDDDGITLDDLVEKVRDGGLRYVEDGRGNCPEE